MTMAGGSIYTVRVSNREPAASGKPIFVTVLMVDADMGIDHLLPYQLGADAAEETRLMPGESKLSGPFQCQGVDGGPPIGGPRTAIALATREPNQFYRLTQASLPMTRGTLSQSPLADLLWEQTFFQTTRGDARLRPTKHIDGSWAIATIHWNVAP